MYEQTYNKTTEKNLEIPKQKLHKHNYQLGSSKSQTHSLTLTIHASEKIRMKKKKKILNLRDGANAPTKRLTPPLHCLQDSKVAHKYITS